MRLLIVYDDLQRSIPREWHDLRDDHAIPFPPKLPRKRIGADERNVDEGWLKTGFVGEFNELGTWAIGPNHDHCFRLGTLDGFQRRTDSARVTFKGAFGDQFEPAAVERALDASEPVPAEEIVLVKDRDLAEVQVLGEVFDPGLRLIAVARADIETLWNSEERRKSAPLNGPIKARCSQPLSAWSPSRSACPRRRSGRTPDPARST